MISVVYIWREWGDKFMWPQNPSLDSLGSTKIFTLKSTNSSIKMSNNSRLGYRKSLRLKSRSLRWENS
jgi:hypothetical protein